MTGSEKRGSFTRIINIQCILPENNPQNFFRMMLQLFAVVPKRHTFKVMMKEYAILRKP